VVSEILKKFTNKGRTPSLYHYRESRGLEVDLLIETAEQLNSVEIKSGSTINSEFFNNLKKFTDIHAGKENIDLWLISGGTESYKRHGTNVISWKNIPSDII